MSIKLATVVSILTITSPQAMEAIVDQLREQHQEPIHDQLRYVNIHEINLENLYTDLKRCEVARLQYENVQAQDLIEPVE